MFWLGVQDLSWFFQTKVWTPAKIFIWNTIERWSPNFSLEIVLLVSSFEEIA
jgi:hypothetical protein